MFGCEAIVDCDDDRMRLQRDLPADDIMRFEIAHDPAAAVKVDERGQHAFGRAVKPQRNCARRFLQPRDREPQRDRELADAALRVCRDTGAVPLMVKCDRSEEG